MFYRYYLSFIDNFVKQSLVKNLTIKHNYSTLLLPVCLTHAILGDMETVIDVQHISKRYKACTALSDVTLSIAKGEICGFIGKNGAGKTTLLRILTDLMRPDEGEYALLGKTSTSKMINRRKIGALVESPAFYADLSAEENLKQLFRIRKVKSFESVQQLLRLVGLEDTRKKPVKGFSLGMKQKLGLAMALEGDPEIIILDEPMNGLDPQAIISLRNLILHLNREKGVTFLISSHILGELTKIATSYIFIHEGKLVRQMTASELDAACTRSLRITVSDPAKAENILTEHAIHCTLLPNTQLHAATEKSVTELVLLLHKSGVVVKECHEQLEHLEAYFISLVGEKL